MGNDAVNWLGGSFHGPPRATLDRHASLRRSGSAEYDSSIQKNLIKWW